MNDDAPGEVCSERDEVLCDDEVAGAIPDADEVRKWHVVHTRPRTEKKLVKLCQKERNMHAYLPLHRRRRRYGARKRESWLPLFPSYVFFHLSADERQFLRQCTSVAAVIDVPEQEDFTHQLRQVYRVLQQSADIDVGPAMKKGLRVTVLSGPFQGLEGVVERLKNKTRVILNIDIIQQAASVEIDAEMLEVVE